MSSPSFLRWVLGPWLATLGALGLFFSWSEARQAERFEQEMERLRTRLEEASVARAAPNPAPAPGPTVCPSPGGMDAATIELIAQRVVAVLESRRSPDAGSPESPAAPEPPPPTAEQRAAVERAHHVLDSAFVRGTLRREDIQELRRQLAQAGPAQKLAEELVRRIAVGLNTQQLVPEDPNFVMP